LEPTAKIEQLFECAPGCIAVVRGPDHVFEVANAAYRRLVAREDLIGRRAADALPELAAQGYLSLLDDVTKSGEPFFADAAPVALQREPGMPPETRFISFVYQPIKDEEGTVTGIFAEGIDVTPSAEADAARRRAERRLQAVLDNASVAIFRMDAEHRTAFMNAAAEELTGYTLAEARGHVLHELVHHSHPDGTHFPVHECPIGQALAGGRRIGGEDVFFHKSGRQITVSYTASPFHDAQDGEPGTIIEVRDISAERKAALALRDREAHLSAFFNQAAAGMSETDSTGRFVRVNDRFCGITGRSREELLGLRMQDITHPHDLPGNLPLFNQAAQGGGSFEIEKRYVRPDGSPVWVHNSVTTVRDETGAPISTICVTIDISDRRIAEERLRESEARQRAITEATPECIKIVGVDGRLIHMNAAGLGMIEAADLESVQGADTLALVASEHREEWRYNHARVIAGESLSWEFDIIGLGGTRRPMETHAVPLALPDGSIAQLAVTRDVSHRKKAEEHQRLLINELNHRVKNTLAIVQGLAQQSFKGHQVPESVRRAFGGRLAALSAAHNILTDRNWEAASLVQIVEDSVSPHRVKEERIVAEGPDLLIPPKMAVSLALALHELATNAAKYGALSAAAGRIEIRWRHENGRLRLVWRESGGPEVEQPATRGFGTRMIERALAADLGGAVKIDFRSEGVVCTIDADLAA
jgi:PAS domain S-box-containing protein